MEYGFDDGEVEGLCKTGSEWARRAAAALQDPNVSSDTLAKVRGIDPSLRHAGTNTTPAELDYGLAAADVADPTPKRIQNAVGGNQLDSQYTPAFSKRVDRSNTPVDNVVRHWDSNRRILNSDSGYQPANHASELQKDTQRVRNERGWSRVEPKAKVVNDEALRSSSLNNSAADKLKYIFSRNADKQYHAETGPMETLPNDPSKYAYKGTSIGDYNQMYNMGNPTRSTPGLYWSGMPEVSHYFNKGLMLQMSAQNEGNFPKFNSETGLPVGGPADWRYRMHEGGSTLLNASDPRGIDPDYYTDMRDSELKTRPIGQNPYFEMVNNEPVDLTKVRAYRQTVHDGMTGVTQGKPILSQTIKQPTEDYADALKQYYGKDITSNAVKRNPYQGLTTDDLPRNIPTTVEPFKLRGPSRSYAPAPVSAQAPAPMQTPEPAPAPAQAPAPSVMDSAKPYTQPITNAMVKAAPFVKNVAQAGVTGLATGVAQNGLDNITHVNPDDNGSGGYWNGVSNRVGSMVNGATAGGTVAGLASGGAAAPLGALGGAAAAGGKNIFDAVKEGVGVVKDYTSTTPSALSEQANANRGPLSKALF